MTLQQLGYVIALNKHRHFVTAADRCFVTQPTITIQVKKLEEEIGFLIFDKRKSPFEPTSLGLLFIEKAKKILHEVEELKSIVNNNLDSLDGKFKIGVIPTISPYLIPLISGDFSKKYKNTVLEIEEIQTKNIISALQKEEIDIGILVTPLDEPFIKETKLYNEPFVFYGKRNGYLESKKSITSDEIKSMSDVWLLESGHCFRNQVLNICDSTNSKNIQFQSGSIEALKKMVDNYGGFTLVPEMATNEDDKGCNIHFTEPKPIREVSIVTNYTFAKDALINALRLEILDKIPPAFVKNKRFTKINWQ